MKKRLRMVDTGKRTKQPPTDLKSIREIELSYKGNKVGFGRPLDDFGEEEEKIAKRERTALEAEQRSFERTPEYLKGVEAQEKYEQERIKPISIS